MIRERRRGVFEIRMDHGRDPMTGKRVQTYHTFKGTKRQAEAEAARLQVERDQGQYVMPEHASVVDFLTIWLRDVAQPSVSPRTFQGYEDMVRLYVKPRLGDVELQSVSPELMQRFYADLGRSGKKGGKEGISPRTIRHVHALLYQALECSLAWGKIRRNPCRGITLPRVRNKDISVLTLKEVGLLLEQVQDTRLHMPVLLALATGMRRGELLALTWRSVDFDANTIAVTQSLSETKAGVHAKEPKTKKGVRTVTIPPDVVEALKAHRAAQEAMQKELGPAYADNDLVLPDRDGSHWRPSNLTGQFRDFVAKIGGPPVRFHDLRHNHVSHLLMQGIPVKVVSDRAGHSGASITLDVYGHLVPGADAQAANVFGNFLRNAVASTRTKTTKSAGKSASKSSVKSAEGGRRVAETVPRAAAA